MKTIQIVLISLCFFAACSPGDDTGEQEANTTDTAAITDTPRVADNFETEHASMDTASTDVFSNARFRNVRLIRQEGNRFLVTGEAQIFEASFGWVVEDGHQELQDSFATADAGAPAWGRFRFVVEAEKRRPESTLHLILFETSMKDGSRQHELPVPLY